MERRGKVYLVGAGPGDPGLITLRGVECIQKADVILYDNLVNPSLLKYARPDAELIFAGKTSKKHTLTQDETNALLVAKASEGKIVTRLKGGDPFVFGRGGEEAQELRKAGIEFEIVPGISSSIAAPAYAGIPVTHREFASAFMVVTGHEDPTKEVGTSFQLVHVERLNDGQAGSLSHGLRAGRPRYCELETSRRVSGHARDPDGRGTHRQDRRELIAHGCRGRHARGDGALGHDGTTANDPGHVGDDRRSCRARGVQAAGGDGDRRSGAVAGAAQLV